MSDHDQIIPVESTPLGIPMMPIEQLKELTAYVNQVKKALMVEGKDYVRTETANTQPAVALLNYIKDSS